MPSIRLGILGLLLLTSACAVSRPGTGVVLSGDPGDESRPEVSPDGTSVIYAWATGEGQRLYRRLLSGGEPVRLTDWDAQEAAPTWSPDGTRVAFKTDRDAWEGIWVAGLDGGEPKRITPTGLKAGDPDWSSTQRITFSSNVEESWDIWTLPAAGGTPERVTDHGGNEWHPQWSPDGSAIVFYTTWDGEMTEVRSIDLRDRTITNISRHPGEDYRPVFSPDGEWIVYISNRGGAADLWATPSKGGDAVQLTADGLSEDFPSWTPDGSSLVFERRDERARMFSIRVDGSAQPTPLSVVEFGSEPVISPNGETLVFLAQFDREPNLWTLQRRGTASKARPILPGNRAQYHPVWSPDGNRIAFVENPGGGPASRNLWSVRPEGADPVQLTRGGGIRNAVWCSNGELLASIDPAATYNHAIWRLDTDGSPVDLLVDTDGNDQVTDCSPDGDSILYTSVIDEANVIFVMDLSDRSVRRLETGFRWAGGARWSPDGTRIAFLSSAGDSLDLYVIPSEGGEPRRLTRSEGWESWPNWSADGTELIYSRVDGGTDLHLLPIDLPPSSSR